MRASDLSFESEFRFSPVPVLLLLPFFGLLLYRVGEATEGSERLSNYVAFVLVLYALAAAGWLLYRWQPLVGRWFTALAAVAVTCLMALWLAIPGALVLVALPVALTTGLISLTAAAIVALGETVLLVGLRLAGIVPISELNVALLAVWATFGAVAAVYYPAHRAAHWSWDYFHQAQALLEKARDRQAELSRALDDLARANQQLTRLNALTQGLRQVAEDARLAKEQFVANVSHELRTPLNMIVGYAEMIMSSPQTYGAGMPAALLADLAVIRRNAEHLADLIDDVLDLSQIEADQMALVRQYVPLDEVVEAATTAVRPLFESKHLYLHTEVATSLPPIFCDRTRIREVLLNLLSNAGRFTEQGGVQLRAEQAGDDLVVSVADTGRGIAAEDMSKLFQPFQQLDGTLRRRFGGTGLGLSISKRFVELHGGRIWVESQVGIGTTFTFRLPLAAPRSASGDFSRWLTPNWEYLQRSGPSLNRPAELRPRLVVLETGSALRRLLARYLAGADIVPVGTLEEGLRELAQAPCQAFLVNGTSVSGTLAQLEGTALPYGVPAVACSVPGAEESAGALGATNYLVKPISAETLLGALEQLELKGNTILIVDDEPEALRLFRRMLSASGRGYHVLRARDGQEAMKLIAEYRPDAILLDLVMPNMDGFQLLHALHEDPTLHQIPVIVISARDPLGQPIVSSALAVTRRGGLSVGNLVAFLRTISEILAAPGVPVGPMQPEAPRDGLAST